LNLTCLNQASRHQSFSFRYRERAQHRRKRFVVIQRERIPSPSSR
jgi:hypothetical protein